MSCTIKSAIFYCANGALRDTLRKIRKSRDVILHRCWLKRGCVNRAAPQSGARPGGGSRAATDSRRAGTVAWGNPPTGPPDCLDPDQAKQAITFFGKKKRAQR